MDKTEDVLDSAESGSLFERLYAQAILNPGGIEANIEKLIQEVRAQAVQGQAGRSLYADVKLDPAFAQQMANHPLPFWVERMTTAYLRAEGGSVIRDLFDLTLTWPDGTRMKRVTFDRKVAQDRLLDHVSLGDERIRDLVQRLPRAIPSQPIARVSLPDFPSEIVGFWSLWRIVLDPDSWRDVKILPLFLHDDGRILVPTARRIWDCLLEDRPAVNQLGSMPDEGVAEVFRSLRLEAERQGQAAFDELLGRHQQRLKREQDKSQYTFQVRRDALNRIGLPEVRQHRLRKLEEEQKAWEAELRRRERVLPELQPVTVLRVEAGNG